VCFDRKSGRLRKIICAAFRQSEESILLNVVMNITPAWDFGSQKENIILGTSRLAGSYQRQKFEFDHLRKDHLRMLSSFILRPICQDHNAVTQEARFRGTSVFAAM
jgi:hypothetical protein